MILLSCNYNKKLNKITGIWELIVVIKIILQLLMLFKFVDILVISKDYKIKLCGKEMENVKN